MRPFKTIIAILCFIPTLLQSQVADYEELLKSANKRIKLNGFYAKTIDLFSECIQMNPTDFRPYFGRASVYYKMEEFNLALSDLDKSIELNPEHLDSYHKSIRICKLTGDANRAIALEGIVQSIESGKEINTVSRSRSQLIGKVNIITNDKYEAWMLKDQFETSEMHQQRIADSNRASAWKSFQNEAINELIEAEPRFQQLSLIGYDADNELFLLDLGVFGRVSISVPLTDARTFNDAIPSMKMENLDCTITDDEIIELSSLLVSYHGKRRRYVSDVNLGYFVPVNTSIQFREADLSAHKEILDSKQGEKRLALIIGNGDYQYGGRLLNPENDARSMTSALESLGFNVIKHENLGITAMRKAIDEFGDKLRDYNIGLFFYAGHGIQTNGQNYLIPVDARIKTENDINYHCVNTGRLLAKMEDAGNRTNIIILDACRDNPFERSWTRSTRGRGLAFMNAPSGSLIAYATSPGSTASDGEGANGLYTAAILRYIDLPGQSILQMFQEVRRYVRTESLGIQTPWESTSLEGDFYFINNE